MKNSFLINSSAIQNLINHNSIIIDIRDEYEYKKQHIKTSINIPYDIFHLYKKRFNKTTPIFLICQYGHKSKELTNQLRQEGYNAYSIKNGYYAITHTINNNYY